MHLFVISEYIDRDKQFPGKRWYLKTGVSEPQDIGREYIQRKRKSMP